MMSTRRLRSLDLFTSYLYGYQSARISKNYVCSPAMIKQKLNLASSAGAKSITFKEAGNNFQQFSNSYTLKDEILAPFNR